MGRFANLEFNREDEPHRKSAETRPLIDAQHHVREAEERWREGRFEKALRSYGRALEHNPQLAEAWVGQVRMLLELDDAKEADLWSDKALEMFPVHGDLLASKAVACARLGRLDEAMKLSDAALRQKGETPWVWEARGDVLLSRGQRNEDFCFSKALALAPKDWFERLVIARIYRMHQRAAAALKWLKDALVLCASSAWLWAQIAACQAELGFAAEAHGGYVNALAIDPECPGARMALLALDTERPSLWRKITKFLKGRRDGG